MDKVKINCTCGAVIEGNVAESILDDIYRWSLSYHCNKCGSATEIDGIGVEDLPDDVRHFIIKKYGEWAISSTNKVKIKYVLTKASLIDNLKICDNDSEILIKGTENEIKWIAIQLKNKKIADFQIYQCSGAESL